MKIFAPNPYARLLAVLFGVTGTLVVHNARLAVAAYGLSLIALLFCHPVRHAHWKFILFVVTPFAFWNLVLWGWLIAAPPGEAHASNPTGGFEYAVLMTARLALLSLVFQLCFIGLPIPRLIQVLQAWGVRGDALLIVASSFTIWPELRNRADHVVTARYARGLIPRRSMWESFKALPFILKPVISNSLHYSIERAEMWHCQELLRAKVQSRSSYRFSMGDVFWPGLSFTWMGLSLWLR